MVYDSYGVMSTDSGSVQADYVSYTGREVERDLRVYYYRTRYYDPLTGRFMVRDPLGFSAGDVNLYRYAGNNPVSLRDPFGFRIDWDVFNPRNPHVRSNFELLNNAIVAMGYPDDSFTLLVTGGDRFPNERGVHVDLDDGIWVWDSDVNSPHLLSRGARAIDFKLLGLNISRAEQRRVVNCALKSTAFTEPNTMPRDKPTYSTGHIHINLPDIAPYNRAIEYYTVPQWSLQSYFRPARRVDAPMFLIK